MGTKEKSECDDASGSSSPNEDEFMDPKESDDSEEGLAFWRQKRQQISFLISLA